MNCKTCTHWTLRGSPLAKDGFGTCAKESDQFRRARCFSPYAPCNKNQHQQASDVTVAKRDIYLAKARA